MMRLIALRELRRLFAAPSTWFILGALQFILAWTFLLRLDAFLQLQSQLTLIANAPGASQLIVSPLSGIVALMMMFESLHRMFEPQRILFNEAIAVALAKLSTAAVVSVSCFRSWARFKASYIGSWAEKTV